MLAPVMTAHKGMVQTQPLAWEAQNWDPHFIFRANILGPSYFVIEISSPEELEDPCIFLDTGYGFRPEYRTDLPATREAAYIVRMRQFPRRVRRVRFDPCSGPGSFTVRTHSARTLNAARALLRIDPNSVHVIDDIKQKKPPRFRRQFDPTEYFGDIVGLARARLATKAGAPALISFVSPVYNTPPAYLDDLLASFISQDRINWELILSDDGSSREETLEWLNRHRSVERLSIVRGDENQGIASATNRGLAAAKGEWIGLIDHDDALAPMALASLNQTIADHPDAAFIYTDEVITDGALKPTGFFFKPAFDPVLLSGVNYINHLSLYRRDRLLAMGGLRLGYEGSQDYELLLRYFAGVPAPSIVHLPYPAYLWRRDGVSFSASSLNLATGHARLALGETYGRDGISCPVEPALVADLHRVRFDLRRLAWPLVSIVIPNRNSLTLISRLLDDLFIRTDYPTLEIIIVDNGSDDEQVLELYERLTREHPNLRIEKSNEPFNFARQTNKGLKLAKGEAVLLLNNDIEIRQADWLKEMVSCLDYAEAGIVGARLLYPSGLIQHSGVIVGLGGLAGHWYSNSDIRTPGPMNRLQVRQSFSAVTAACMLISRPCYEATGDFDEETFAIAYNDVDYCLRASRAGFRTVWTPFATLIHHESASRGSDETRENRLRFHRERTALRTKYHTDKFDDPAFSPWYSTGYSVPREAVPDRLPQARTWPAASEHGRTTAPSQGTE